MLQPFFSVSGLRTSLQIANGATVLMAGGLPSTNPGKTVYVFATANSRKIGTRPHRWYRNDDELPEAKEAVDEVEELEARRLDVSRDLVAYYRKEGFDDANEWFEAWGLGGPEGSSAEYRPHSHELLLTNTPSNLHQIHGILRRAGLLTYPVEVQVDFVEYTRDDIERLAREATLNGDTLRRLWQEEKARLKHTLRGVASDGRQFTVKRAIENRYPTAFESAATPDADGPAAAKASGIVVPSGFETREVGAIAMSVPDISRDGEWISLTLCPQVVGVPEWKDYAGPPRTAAGAVVEQPMPQPFYPVISLTTSVLVADGDTVLLGGGGTGDVENEKPVYAFVTVRLVDPEGQPLR